MRKTQRRSAGQGSPSAFGMGLVSLDVILDPSGTELLYAGGTTGNVMAILSYLGWNSYPVARLAQDRAFEILVADLARWGVKLDYLSLRPSASTPVIVERLSKDASGVPFHSFSFACPGCGGRLPSFQPVVLRALDSPAAALKNAQVLFLDRVSPSAIELATKAKDAGAIIYFEPTSVRDEKQFRRLIELADIVKYAQDRIVDLEEICDPANVWLEIQTLGRGGLRFRMPHLRGIHDWHVAQASVVENMQDAAGSGDWLSATLIHLLCRSGREAMMDSALSTVTRALNAGQVVAGWNCQFVGPRGGMYQRPRTEVLQLLRASFNSSLRAPRTEYKTSDPKAVPGGFCAACSGDSRQKKEVKHKSSFDRALM